MKRILGLVCAAAVLSSLIPSMQGAAKAVSFAEVDTIGVMPSAYVGTMTLENVNTVEQDYASGNAFPSQGVAMLPDGGIVVCDTAYGRLHVFSADLTHRQTIGSLGSGRGQLQYPADVAVDGSGNIYAVDFFGNKVVKYAADGSVIMEFGSEGKAAGQFQGPAGIAVTSDGDIWVADQLNDRVERFSSAGLPLAVVTGIAHPAGMTAAGMTPYVVGEGGVVCTVNGTKTVQIFAAPGDAENLLSSSADLAVDGKGNIYVADRGTGKLPVPAVKEFSGSGQYLRSFGGYPEDMTDIQDEELLSPGGVAVTSDGTVYAMNSGFFRDATNPFGSGFQAKLVEYAPGGGVVNAQAYAIDQPGRLNDPRDVTVDGKGQLWVVCGAPAVAPDGQTIAWSRGYVKVLDHSGNELLTVAKAGSRTLQLAESIAANGAGLVYIGAEDARGGFVAVYDESGDYIRTIASGAVDHPYGLGVAADGTLWVCNQGDGSVVHLSADGAELGRFPTPGMPASLAFLPGGDLLVCVWGELSDVQQVIRYTPAGVVVKVYGTAGGGRGTGQMYYPLDAVLLPDGLVLVSDAENGRFVAFNQNGSVAWTTRGAWYIPGRMAWSPDGMLYVTDGFHNVVRELCYGDRTAPRGASLTARLDSVRAVVPAGGTAHLQLSLRNWSAQADTFTVLPETGGSGWACSAVPSSVSVLPGATAHVTVTVQAPGRAAPGTAGAVSIAVQSALDPADTTTVHADVVVRTPSVVLVGGTAVEAEMGSTVTIPLQVRDAENLYAAGCRVDYDDTALQLVSVTRGDLLGGGALFIEDHATTGRVRLAAALKGDDLPVSGGGSLALLTFRALEAGTTQLDVDELQLFGGSLGEDEFAGKARSIPVRVTAPPARTTLVLQISSSAMKVGKASVALDCPPLIIEGRTLVPIRAVVESLGGIVSWDTAARTATVSLGGVSLKLTVGQATALVNDRQVPIDSSNPGVVPRVISGRTMLPLRFVAENLGADVQWEGSTQTITITYPKS